MINFFSSILAHNFLTYSILKCSGIISVRLYSNDNLKEDTIVEKRRLGLKTKIKTVAAFVIRHLQTVKEF